MDQESTVLEEKIGNENRRFPHLLEVIRSFPLHAETIEKVNLTLNELPAGVSEEELRLGAAVNYLRLEVWLGESYLITAGRSRSLIAVSLRALFNINRRSRRRSILSHRIFNKQ